MRCLRCQGLLVEDLYDERKIRLRCVNCGEMTKERADDERDSQKPKRNGLAPVRQR